MDLSDQQRLAHIESIVNALEGVVWEFDWSTRAFTWVSAGCEALLGFTRDEWLRPGFWMERVHEDDRTEAAEYCEASTLKGIDHEFEYRMVRADGSIIWVRDMVSVDPVRRKGAPLRGVLIDITAQKQAETALLESEQRFRNVFERVGMIAATVDVDGRLQYVNDNACRLLGMDREDLLGSLFTDCVAEEHRAVFREEHAARMRGERDSTPVDLPLLTREGDLRVVRVQSATLYDNQGRPNGAAAAGVDITQRELAEQRHRAQAEEFDAVFRLLRDLYFRVDDDGVVEEYRAPEPNGLHAPPESFLGKRLEEVFPLHAAAALMRELERCRETGEMTIAEYELGQDGEMREWEARYLPLETGKVSVVLRDITDRKRAEHRIRESEMRFRSIVEEAPFGLHLYEVRGDDLVLTAANEAADRVLAFSHAPLVGKTVEEAFPASVEAGWPMVYRRIATEGGSWHAEVPYSDGQIMGVYDTTVFQTSPGRIAVAFVDVTERRAIEHADRMHQLKVSALAAQLASAEDRERRRLAEELHDRVSQALAVTRMHLSAAVDEQGRLDRDEFDVALAMLEEAITETRAVTTELYPPVLHELGLGAALTWLGEEFEKAHGLKCTVTVTEAPVALGEEASSVLFRTARELLMNVVKHAETDRAWVSLDVTDVAVILTVADAGQGMSQGNGQSGGFGLFSIKERLPHLGGTADVESTPGEGTSVTVTVPLALR